MIKKPIHVLNKKDVKRRSLKLKCATHGEISSKEPCDTCSNCNRSISSSNVEKGYTNTGTKKFSKNTKAVNLDQSIDLFPTKLYTKKQVINDKAKILPQNKFDSASAKYTAPAVKRTTWDHILREQNVDLVRIQSDRKSKAISKHKINKTGPSAKVDYIHHDHLNEHMHTSKESKSNYSNIVKESVDKRFKPVDYTDSASHKTQLYNFSLSRHNLKGGSINHVASTTNPVLTLDLLVKELREKLQKQAIDVDLQRIILDMENALISFPSVTAPEHENCGRIPRPEEFQKSIQKKFDIVDCKSIEQLHLKLEENCKFLQDVYNQLHKESKKHKEEKERLTQNLTECRRLLAISKSKEKENEEIIKALRLGLQDKSNKVDHDGQAIHELTQIISRLQEENKTVASLRTAHAKLFEKYNEVIVEKEHLNSKFQLVSMEKEKLLALMQVKDNELKKMQNNLEDIKSMFGNNLENLEVVREPENYNLDSTISSNWDKESDERFRPICSSPTSSIPGSSPSPYSSWQVISSIPQKPKATLELKQGILDLFTEMKRTTKELNPNKLLPLLELNGGSGISDSNDEDGLQFKSISKLSIPSDIAESELSS